MWATGSALQGQPAVCPGFSSWLCPQVPLVSVFPPACAPCFGVHPVISGGRAAEGGVRAVGSSSRRQRPQACVTLPPYVVFPSERKW